MRLVLIALAASAGFGQTTKVFQFTQNQSAQDLREISVVLRATADIQQQSIDDKTRSITVNAPDGQVAMASWVVQQLDLPPAATSGGGVREYRPPAGGDEVVRVFYAEHAPRPQDLQELVTTIRSIADIQRLFVYNALHAVVMRGPNQRISLAAWLMDELDQPAGTPAPSPQEYKLSGDDVARVFDLANPQTPEQLQEIATLVRSVADVMRLFICVNRRAMAVRATTERVALATWLVHELDRPADALAAGGASHEFRLTNDPENVVRVFYLAKPESGEDLQKAAIRVREATGARRLFVYGPLAALAVRGSAVQLAVAEKAVAAMQTR